MFDETLLFCSSLNDGNKRILSKNDIDNLEKIAREKLEKRNESEVAKHDAIEIFLQLSELRPEKKFYHYEILAILYQMIGDKYKYMLYLKKAEKARSKMAKQILRHIEPRTIDTIKLKAKRFLNNLVNWKLVNQIKKK